LEHVMADAATVTTVVTTLAPAFAAGFAVQQGLQILDSFLTLDKKITPVTKTGLAGLVSLGLGFAFAWGGIYVLSPLSSSTKAGSWVDLLVSALVISGGTEGFNSIMKFMGYKKDEANPAKAPNNDAAGQGGPNAVGKAA
jgi:hypothetical protein